ncbi:hypothetical protein ONZ45_g19684 [Pleurotus djamor]|nr:hypothetical protein ONZ45_g19684 [Pleurotus djamor]
MTAPDFPSSQAVESLVEIARRLVTPRGKGIYATDEDPSVIEARLIAAGGAAVQNDKDRSDEEKRERRRRWRECLYETIPVEYISGVILYPETLHAFQLAPVLANRGIIPGIRANGEEYPLPTSPEEPITDGLDNLFPRMQAAYIDGARFSKFRTGFSCTSLASGALPTQLAIDAQAETLARFAAVSQQAGLVPIVEPDVDFSGDADLQRSKEVHEKIISAIYARCVAHGVLIEGGLTDEQSTSYLNAVNKAVLDSPEASSVKRLPPLSFSFGRGLQGEAMTRWVAGDEAGAKAAFEVRAKACSQAAKGEYTK